MATALYVLVVTLVSLAVTPVVFARECDGYKDIHGIYQSSRQCGVQFCCGTCYNRYCCSSAFFEFDDDKCSSFYSDSDVNTAAIAGGVGVTIFLISLFICCCVCPCCCLYKMCRSPRPVVATTTHTVINTTYPQQPTAAPNQGYQATHYSGYQPMPVQQSYGGQPIQPAYGGQPMQPAYGGQPMQPGYGGQPMQPGYGGQPMQPGYGGQPMPTAPHQGQPCMPGPPPPYQEPGTGFPAAMPYSQAAFAPGQTPYPLQPPAQPGQLPPQPDHHSSQPAYNPAYVEPQPPKTGY
ncbi:calcium-binding protein P isoform X2 [Hypomesus transpacificus]|uniref:calcium-binding protein P isoform X2 n=1 Tax=Hypomesus transpacificus TaxID=137520 RepID=UPI001F073D67|nr:calcium-binding protein P isoform X2 [Hypomesus transpacificus]